MNKQSNVNPTYAISVCVQVLSEASEVLRTSTTDNEGIERDMTLTDALDCALDAVHCYHPGMGREPFLTVIKALEAMFEVREERTKSYSAATGLNGELSTVKGEAYKRSA